MFKPMIIISEEKFYKKIVFWCAQFATFGSSINDVTVLMIRSQGFYGNLN
jgi:hypothetical protein